MFDACVVGAGAAGLAARRELARAGLRPAVLEKSRGAGGRMATRRSEGLRADVGAQFAAARDPDWAATLRAAGDAVVELRLPGEAEFPRYAHRLGMSAMARLLLDGTEEGLFFGRRAARIDRRAGGLVIVCEDGFEVEARAAVLTAPVPQSLALLARSGIEMPQADAETLGGIAYDPCLAVIAELERESGLAAPGILRSPSAAIAGIHDQGAKGLATDRPTLVVHASASLSQRLWAQADADAAREVWEAAVAALAGHHPGEEPPRVRSLSLHRWLYSEPRTLRSSLFHRCDWGGAWVLLAGDAFGGSPSVGGALASGRAAGAELARLLAPGARADARERA